MEIRPTPQEKPARRTGAYSAPSEAEAFFEEVAAEEGADHLGDDAGGEAGAESADEAVAEHDGGAAEGEAGVEKDARRRRSRRCISI